MERDQYGRFWFCVLAVTLLSIAVVDAETFDFTPLDGILQQYVDTTGMVDYRALQNDRQRLDDTVRALGNVPQRTFQSWSKEDQIAFLINAYNARTLQVIIDHYPIQGRKWTFPPSSIRQIAGAWDELTFPLLDSDRTLDEIEHRILRRRYKEPRIHMALVCAAMGCPPLRNEAYTGDRLSEQLDSQTQAFLADPKKFRIDRKEGRVHLSPIFKWFGGDFKEAYGEVLQGNRFSDAKRAVLGFASGYLGNEDQAYLLSGDYRVKFLKYDWSLNEQGNRHEP